ncbi:MAG: CC0125/CC1285 family lipoprotein [Pseudomonadota bacterium]
MRYLIAPLLALSIALAVSGCVTPYQKDSAWNAVVGGYSDYRVDENTFIVSFRGGNPTPVAKLGPYLLYRCAEVIAGAGFEYFQIVGQSPDQKVGTAVLPGYSTTQGSATGYVTGNTVQAFGSSQTTTIPPQLLTYRENTLTATIKAHRGEKPSGDAVYRAADVLKYLGPSVKGK